MTYRGHVKNGVVVLDDPVALPEGCKVAVVLTPATEGAGENGTPTLFDQLAAVIGKGQQLPSDLAANHDHYLHGLPKK
jgi:hypothetical protein